MASPEEAERPAPMMATIFRDLARWFWKSAIKSGSRGGVRGWTASELVANDDMVDLGGVDDDGDDNLASDDGDN